MRIEIRGPSEDAVDKIDPIVARVAEVQKANPELYVGSFGESTGKALTASFGDDLKRAGLFSVPLTLIILLVAFGALVAAGIPLLLGLTSVLATLGLVAVISKVLPMSGDISAIVLLIGLAVGVDYTMFYLKREREERAAGRSKEAALEAAAATSGRSVLVSGSTVLVAMAGMFFTADATFASFGVATMTVVAVAMLGSLTVLPALLSKLGDKVDRGRLSFIHGRRRNGESRVWGAIIDRVLRRPLLSALLAGGLLARDRGARVPTPDRAAQHRHVSAEAAGNLQPHQGSLPRRAERDDRRRQGAERRGTGGTRRRRRAKTACACDGRHERADRRRHQRCEDGGEHHDRDRGRRNRLGVERGSHRAPRRHHPLDDRCRSGERGRRDRNDRLHARLQAADEDGCAARVRFCACCSRLG